MIVSYWCSALAVPYSLDSSLLVLCTGRAIFFGPHLCLQLCREAFTVFLLAKFHEFFAGQISRYFGWQNLTLAKFDFDF